MTTNKREMSDLKGYVVQMERTQEKNQAEIIALRNTIGDQLEAMSTLTSGARDAVVTATHQTDAMNDEIGTKSFSLLWTILFFPLTYLLTPIFGF